MSDAIKTLQIFEPSTGDKINVPESQANTYFAMGYRPVTAESEATQKEQAEFGNRPVSAALLGAARGATFGLSDLALSKLKFGSEPIVAPETLAALEKHNPEASAIGEWGSILAPGLGALGVFGKGGKIAARTLGAGVEGASALGSAVKTRATAVAKTLGADEASVLGRIAASHLPRALGLSAEAELYNIGHNLSKAVLENEDLTAESLLANSTNALEVGAAFGLGAPAALRLGRELFDHAVPQIIKAAPRKIGAAVYDRVAKFFDPDRMLALYSGAGGRSSLWMHTLEGDKFRQAYKGLREAGFYRPGEMVSDLETGGWKQSAKGSLPSQEDAMERLASGIADRENAMQRLLSAADDALAQQGAAAGPWRVGSAAEAKQVQSFGRKLASDMAEFEPGALKELRGKISAWRSNRQITPEDAARLEATIADVSGGLAEKSGSFVGMNDLKRGLYRRISDMNKNAYHAPVSNENVIVLKDLARMVKENIESGVEMLKNETAYRGIATQLAPVKRLNQTLGWLHEIRGPLDRALAKSEANVNVGGLRWRDMMSSAFGGALGSAVGGPVGGVVGAGAGFLQKWLQTDTGLLARARIGEEFAALVGANHALSTARAVLAGGAKQFVTGKVEPAVTKLLPRVLGKLAADHADEHVAMAGVDPERLAASMADHSPTARLVSPGVADKMTMKRLKALMQLKTLRPSNPAQQLYLNPMQAIHGASQADVFRYRQQKRAAAQPLSVVHDLINGRLHKDTLAVTQALYPALVDELKRNVVEAVAAHDKPLPASKMAQLGLLFDVPIDPSLRPEIMRGLASIAQTPQKDSGQEQPKGGARQAGALKMKPESGKTVSERLLA